MLRCLFAPLNQPHNLLLRAGRLWHFIPTAHALAFASSCSSFLLGPLAASAQTREHIVLTGGPALRFMEHGKDASHDFYWFNFIDASTIWLKQIKDTVAGQRPRQLAGLPALVRLAQQGIGHGSHSRRSRTKAKRAERERFSSSTPRTS